ncbi:hypothetical protein Dtox_2771 [Desulfofarcimen acetoxidans DSM 771]|uniref:Uncharacterized protein n=1 Tax=Desulfofarcimen acetoxidans (strain ATCC 49208 / DSM 771 / KCTC 5769 / VKM B-1644 / 5575) TaxID=485916 RepID=C8W1S1_DESAS|nr:hypothetical protein [Desulfofarcimen acetoxidans]ACV63542.1 hypothetical protein Dtox_2771 [Desulfofarcimen acetoxidans DSM 771]
MPDKRNKAIHYCAHYKFFVTVKGKQQTKNAYVVNSKAYGNLEKRIPFEIPIIEIIKLVGLEGLNKYIKNGNLDAQSRSKFAVSRIMGQMVNFI